MLAAPKGHLKILDDGYQWSGPSWPELEQALEKVPSDDPLAIMDAAIKVDQNRTITDTDAEIPFVGGWVVSLKYELGVHIERAAGSASTLPRGVLADFLWCPDAVLHDTHTKHWWRIGDAEPWESHREPHAPLTIGEWESHPDRRGFEDAVSRTIELIHRGDLFQANIARQLTTRCTGDLRNFALDALQASGAWFGCYMELPGSEVDRAILGMSPELFLDIDARSGLVRSRPIKGTRPIDVSAHELANSEKDMAELNMIVDLMRNDLGRICELGSIEVSQSRCIESHPTVHHGVAEISGRLRAQTAFSDLLKATFPPGSVTGAPKIRAMQVIDELEHLPRGPYCGAVGCLSTAGDLRLGVSIRTTAFEGKSNGFRAVSGTLMYGTGCGIVADSIPADEYLESEHKAAALRRLSVQQA